MSKKPAGMFGVVAGRTRAMWCRGTRGEGCSHSRLCAGLGKGQVEWDSTSTWHQAAGGLATPANRGQYSLKSIQSRMFSNSINDY